MYVDSYRYSYIRVNIRENNIDINKIKSVLIRHDNINCYQLIHQIKRR
jgi:hypothetical protein